MNTQNNDKKIKERIAQLSEQEKKVIQHGGTETPFQNEFWDKKDSGMYRCKVCGTQLFASNTKLDSSEGPMGLRGWPAFDQAIPGTVKFVEDTTLGMHRTEVVCATCGAHLGHLFDDDTKTGKHFCINSCSLDFEEMEK